MRRIYTSFELQKMIEEMVYAPTDGKKYKVVAGVIRNTNGTWHLIDNHEPINVESVSNNISNIIINYKFLAKKVIAFLVTPDETFAGLGYFCGASVDNDKCAIDIYQDGNLGGYIAWNGSAFDCYGDITSASIDGDTGVITINHKKATGFGRSLTSRSVAYRPILESIAEEQDFFYMYDANGDVVTTPTTDFKVFWGNSAQPRKLVPADANEQGNLWFYGIFEV